MEPLLAEEGLVIRVDELANTFKIDILNITLTYHKRSYLQCKLLTDTDA